jgi:hypothetical protein
VDFVIFLNAAGHPLFCLDCGILYPSRDPNLAIRELLWFGLRVVGILETFYSQAIIKRTIDDSPSVSEHSLAEKDPGLCPYNPCTE